MKILVISRLYWPDTVSVAQHLGDLTFALSRAGHSVTVLTSRHAYENPDITYPGQENQEEVEIIRMRHFAADKRSKILRILDFLLFNLLVFVRMLFMRRKQYDLVLGLTNPPLLSFLGIIAARWKGMKFSYWTMDLQPELAIAAGYMREGSLSARTLSFLGDYIFNRADHMLTLDRFMKEHIVKRGGHADRVTVLPPWPVVPSVFEGQRMENSFRLEQGFEDKIVIMYSGNHAVVHPLNTVLEAALSLRHDPRFLFVFIGGGVRKQDVTDFKAQHQLDTILQLPYQPREIIHLSLGSADIQVVILGDEHTGYTHPNKVYGAMYIGKPILYVGPDKSHVGDILEACPGNIHVKHGEASVLVQELVAFADRGESNWQSVGHQNMAYAQKIVDPETLIQAHVASIETLGPKEDSPSSPVMTHQS